MGWPSQILLEFPIDQTPPLPDNLHATTGFGHYQVSRKSIPTSHLEKNGNHWFEGDKVFTWTFVPCAKNWSRYWQHSNEQCSHHLPCVQGACSLFVEQALNRHYTKEDKIFSFDKSNKGMLFFYLPQNLPLYLLHYHFLFVLGWKVWEENVYTYWKSQCKDWAAFLCSAHSHIFLFK